MTCKHPPIFGIENDISLEGSGECTPPTRFMTQWQVNRFSIK